MKPIRRQKLFFIVALLFSLGIASGLILYGLRKNINAYYTSTDIFEGKVPTHKTFRLGGYVEKDSFQHFNTGLKVQFTVTDQEHQTVIYYTGILPDLFREGQGVIVEGKLNDRGVFVAQEVLAKHDNNYQPPKLKKHVVNKED
jgi:cytochrome c-type biogenesis protein CcmE